MKITDVQFLASNTQVSKLPPPNLPEYVFIGRSNVGKSSLINSLLKKTIAKTSGTPGKTQLINHFSINKNWYLVDLPGYGYARVSQTNREKWMKMILTYLDKRENLQCVFLLIDSRLSPQKKDIEFCCTLGRMGLSFVLVFTKADKQSRVQTDKNISLFKKDFLLHFEALPPFFITSAESGLGRDEILEFIDDVNERFLMPSMS